MGSWKLNTAKKIHQFGRKLQNFPPAKKTSYTVVFISSPGQRPCGLLPSLGVRRKLSHLNLFLWNRWTKLSQTWQGWSLDGSLSHYVRQSCPPFKMAAVTKNRNFFNCPLLLYYKSNCSYMEMSSLTFILWNFSFSRFIPIMQIRHILIKDHI